MTLNLLAAKGGQRTNNETTSGWISKVIWGTEPEGEVRAETTFDIRLHIDLAAKG